MKNGKPETLSEASENLNNAVGEFKREFLKSLEPIPPKAVPWFFVSLFLLLDIILRVLIGDY